MDWGQCVENDVATLQCIPIIFKNVIYGALAFSGIVALFIIIVSGIKFITSHGDQKQLSGAKRTLTFAIIGLTIIIFSFFIVKVISVVTGVECINLSTIGFNTCN